MPRIFRSMSGEILDLSDADRVLCIISDTRYQHTTNKMGDQIVGLNAVRILQALKDEGFVIVRAPQSADPGQ